MATGVVLKEPALHMALPVLNRETAAPSGIRVSDLHLCHSQDSEVQSHWPKVTKCLGSLGTSTSVFLTPELSLERVPELGSGSVTSLESTM